MTQRAQFGTKARFVIFLWKGTDQFCTDLAAGKGGLFFVLRNKRGKSAVVHPAPEGLYRRQIIHHMGKPLGVKAPLKCSRYIRDGIITFSDGIGKGVKSHLIAFGLSLGIIQPFAQLAKVLPASQISAAQLGHIEFPYILRREQ